MIEKRIQLAEGAHLTLDEMAGSVTLSGRDQADVLIRLSDDGEQYLSIEESDDGPVVAAQTSCELLVPSHLPVAIRGVAGNLTVKNLDAQLNAEQVRGNLVLSGVQEAAFAEVYGKLKASDMSSLRVAGTIYGDAIVKGIQSIELQNIRGNLRAKEAGHLRVSRVGGNCQAKGIAGNLDAEQIGGNALLKEIAGMTNLARVAGNLIAKDLSGGAKAARIGGNLVLNGELGAGRTYYFEADGNASLRLTEETNAYLNLTAKGMLSVPETVVVQEREGNTLCGTLGDGGAEVFVKAKGNVAVGGSGSSYSPELGEEISRQIEESLQAIDLEAIGRQVSEEMESALSRLRVKLETTDWERIGSQARQAVELAMDRMQRDVDRLAEKTARQQERVERKVEREVRRQEKRTRQGKPAGRRSPAEMEGTDPYAPTSEETAIIEPEPEQDLEEERLSILRMVEQGQITPEEAEMLMDALLQT